MSDTRWLTVRDVAFSLNVHEETVRRWIRRGNLVAIDLGGPRAGYRVRPSDLEEFLENDQGARRSTGRCSEPESDLT